jgi:hypothetical protein
MNGRRKSGQIALRILYALLLVFVGFSHRPPEAGAAPQSAAFFLPDGTAASLCLADGDDRSGAKHVDHGCDACRIAGGMDLAPRLNCDGMIMGRRSEPLPLPVSRSFHRSLFPPSAPPRGPPALLFI